MLLPLQVAAGSASPRRRRRASSSSSLPPSRQLSADEAAELEELAALPLADSAAVDRVAAWLGRLVAGGGGGEALLPAGGADANTGFGGADGALVGPESLQEALLPLVMGLRRLGRLPALLRQFREASAARLKDFLRWGAGGAVACVGALPVATRCVASAGCAAAAR